MEYTQTKPIFINAYYANGLNLVSELCTKTLLFKVWFGIKNCSHLKSPNVVLLKRKGGESWVGDESLVVDRQNVSISHSNPRKSPEI